MTTCRGACSGLGKRGTGPVHLLPPGAQALTIGLAPQGDVLITSCTYNTEDRKLATVVSHPTFPCCLPTGCVRPGVGVGGSHLGLCMIS